MLGCVHARARVRVSSTFLSERSGKLELGSEPLGVGMVKEKKSVSGEVLPGFWKSQEIGDLETRGVGGKKKSSFGMILMKHRGDFAMSLE